MNEDGSLAARAGYAELDGIPTCEAIRIQTSLGQTLNAALKPIIYRVRERMEPLACSNAQTDPRIDNAEQIREFKSFLAMPCAYEGHLVAIAIACATSDLHTFTEEEIELAWGISNVVAPAIANARLHEKVQSLAAREERAQLAQEMHDRLAQILRTLSLKADVAADLLSDQPTSDRVRRPGWRGGRRASAGGHPSAPLESSQPSSCLIPDYLGCS